jgi:hypothetical protein
MVQTSVTALSSSTCHRIQSLEFDACIRRPELSVDGANALVALLLPLLNLTTKLLNGGDVVSQALPRQDAEFNLSNIEPTGVLGCVMDLQAIGQSFGLFRREDFVEGGLRVGIEVVHDHHDFCHLGIVHFEDFLHEERPVLLGALTGHGEKPFAS